MPKQLTMPVWLVHLNKMKCSSLSIIFASIFSITVCLAQVSVFQHLDETNRLISSGNCASAETYAMKNIQIPIWHTVMGYINLDCRHNKKAAIDFFRLAASQGESLAAQTLISLGETPPEPPRLNGESQVERQHIPQPPPFLLPPQQQVSPQQIIIQQQQAMPNPNACIQDGGTLFCPNHPNTKITPFKPFGPLKY